MRNTAGIVDVHELPENVRLRSLSVLSESGLGEKLTETLSG